MLFDYSTYLDLFATERNNLKRQMELDVAKVLAIILMIIVNSLSFCSLCKIDLSYLKECFFILRLCSNLLFIFAVGVGMVYTKNTSSKEFIARGVKLILMGMIINLTYFVSGYESGLELEYCILYLISSNIFVFSGFSFILVGFF